MEQPNKGAKIIVYGTTPNMLESKSETGWIEKGKNTILGSQRLIIEVGKAANKALKSQETTRFLNTYHNTDQSTTMTET